MKKLIIGLAICGLTFACKCSDSAQVSDASDASAPAMDCCAKKDGSCEKTDGCETMAKPNCGGGDGGGCSSMAGKKVCPMTGKVIE